ncbi:MAG: SLC26A/SulP transporter family protein [Elusimicrobia bacterium]|nr:SLC26A/SulP transporter family protein [Elusimicrobiota bacterium]
MNPQPKASSSAARLSDVWGGLAAMLVALPQALAFGVAIFSPLGPERAAEGAVAGFIGASSLGILAALFGGAPRLISTPCAPAAAVMGALAARLVVSQPPGQVVLLLTVAALICGGLQMSFGAVGGGRLIKYIPYPVVTGYLSGVAILIFLGQAPKLLVLPKGMDLWHGLLHPSVWSGPGLIVGAAAIASMALAPLLTEAVPGPVIGLSAGIAAYWTASVFWPELKVLEHNAVVVGSLPGAGGGLWASLAERWTSVKALSTGQLKEVLMPAATLSILLSVDTLKTCVVVDALTRSRHDSDRTLLGQGVGNFTSALLGGVPGAGAMGPTLVNVNSGGRTRLSGVLAGSFALLAFLIARPLMAWIPVPALAGILIVVAWRMFDRKSLALLRKRSTVFDFAVSATVIAVAVTVDLIAAAGAGLALAALLFIRDLMRGSVIRRKIYGDHISSRQRRLPAERESLKELSSQVVVCELQGSLFFGTTDQLFTELEADLKTRRFLILDLKHVQSVDFTAVHMLKQVEDRLHAKRGRLILCDLPHSLPSGRDLEEYFNEVGLVKAKRFVSIFGELDAALEWAEDRLLEEAGKLEPHSPIPLELHEIDIMRGMEADALAAFHSILREASFETGQRLFSRNDSGDEMFLIRRGQVRIILPLDGGKGHHIATLGRSDFFGEVAFLDRGLRSADAVAISPTMVYAMSRAKFDEFSRSRPDLGAMLFARIARALAMRLRMADEELRALQEA